MAIIISADEIKKTLTGYLPKNAEEFHAESAAKADKIFEHTLKNSAIKNVILMNGGAAAGKTEFLETQLINKNFIIFDTTLSTIEGAKIKIKKIIKAQKKPFIYSVIPVDLEKAFNAFMHRDRRFGEKHFYRTHANSRAVLLFIAQNYPDVQIKVVESHYYSGIKMEFEILPIKTENELLFKLESLQITENKINDIIEIVKVSDE